MAGCFGFHEAPPMCSPDECNKWYRDSRIEVGSAPPPYFHRVYPLNRTAGWTLGAKWESRVPIANPHARPNTWVEVLRYRINLREGEAGYGCAQPLQRVTLCPSTWHIPSTWQVLVQSRAGLGCVD